MFVHYILGEFSSFDWSPDESKILYIAEKKIKKSEPFYKRKAPKEDGDKDIVVVSFKQFNYSCMTLICYFYFHTPI